MFVSCFHYRIYICLNFSLHNSFYPYSEMGLPAIATDFDFEEQAQRIESDELLNDFYGAEKIRRSPQQFVTDQVEKLNKDQRAAFDRISSAILDGRGRRLFFVEGAGGCGNFFSVLFADFFYFSC